MTSVLFACPRCAWRGPSLTGLLEHACAAAVVIKPVTPEPAPAICAHCGKPLPTSDKRPRKFCSAECRQLARDAAKPAKVPHTFHCALCKREVTTTSKRRKFCSEQCRARFTGRDASVNRRRLQRPSDPRPIAPLPIRERLPVVVDAPRASAARRTRIESLFGVPKATEVARPTARRLLERPAAIDDDFEPERLPAGGTVSAGPEPTANPSHPVRSTVRPAQWRRLTPEPAAPGHYCACGMLLPLVLPERCPDCGRPVKSPSEKSTLENR